MVIQKKTKNDKPNPKLETIEETKERLLSTLHDYSIDIITLAVMYATNFEQIGEDVTKKWITTDQQTRILQQAYNKGYEDALKEKQDKK